MQKYVNMHQINITVAVWLATDNYDHKDDPLNISVTALMKPVKEIILSRRVTGSGVVDITSNTPSALGNAIHDAIERSLQQPQKALSLLGYPESVIDKVLINPEPRDIFPDCIPIYLERRTDRKVGKYTVSGKFDAVVDGRVEDHKSTSAYTYSSGIKDDDYILQGSIYRWLNPDIVTQDVMDINFIITNFDNIKATSDPSYPPQRVCSKTFNLIPVQQVENYVTHKINLLDSLMDSPEELIPECTDDELKRTKSVFKYYKNPMSTGRSTANFPTLMEANIRLHADGSIGIVREVKGTITACKYCKAVSVCKQKDRYLVDGSLKLQE
jgi:hypothetical protein